MTIIVILILALLFFVSITLIVHIYKTMGSKKEDNSGTSTYPRLKKLWGMMYADKKDDDSKKLALYIATIVIAYTIAHFAPTGKELVWRGATALILLHFIWTFSPGKASTFTWFIVGGMLTYFVLAWAFPNDAPRILKAAGGYSQHIMASIADRAESANNNFGKTSPTEVVSEWPNNDGVKSESITIPTDARVAVTPPEGYRLSSIECPRENIIAVTEPSAYHIVYKVVDCGESDVLVKLGKNSIRNKELVISLKPGVFLQSNVIFWWVKA